MVWVAMSSMGTAGLCFLPPGTTINGEKYVNLLKSKLEIHMTIHNCQILCMMALHVIEASDEEILKAKKIRTLEWPGNSPDLNPIKNLWCVMKNKVSEKHPTSLCAL